MARARLESEAGRAADRAASGRPAPATQLSPSAPARPLGGTGAPLPSGVRERLERVFDADLAAVRVHTGPAAAARLDGERALAAGAHVYLGPGDSPAAATTFPILAHEIAHVLQQTAEPDHTGRLVARDLAGTAAPLAWEAPFPGTSNPLPTEQLLAEWLRFARTRDAPTAIEQIEALIASQDGADPAVFWTMRAVLIRSGQPDPAFTPAGQAPLSLDDLHPLARAALFDGLKRNGQTAAAALLLRRHDDTETLLRDPATYLAYVDLVGPTSLLDRILEIWEDPATPILGEARPRKLMALSAAWLLGSFNQVLETPIDDAQRVTLLGGFPQRLREKEAAGEFFPNELFRAAFRAIRELEQIRIQVLQPDPLRRTTVTGDDRLDQRIAIADRLVAWAAWVREHAQQIEAGTESGLRGGIEARYLVVRELAPALGALGQFALDYWALGALAGYAAVGHRLDEALARGITPETLRGIGASPEPFPGLQRDLLAHANRFFPRQGEGAVASPSSYRQRVQNSRRDLDRIVGAIQSRVIERINRAWAVRGRPLGFDASRIPSDRTQLLAQSAWLVANLRAYRKILDGYSPDEDRAHRQRFAAEVAQLDPPVPNWPGDDVRVLHRGRAAQRLLSLASTAGLTEVEAVVRPIVEARESWQGGRQTEDVLAIARPFEPQPEVPIRKMEEDLGPGPVEGIEELTVRQLVLYFEADHYRRVARHIDRLLREWRRGGRQFARNEDPILNRAQTAERTSDEHPLRHRLGREGFLYLPRSRQAPAPAGSRTSQPVAQRPSLRALFAQHPVVRATIRTWPGHLLAIPGNPPAEVVLWRLPDLARLADVFAVIPEVNQLLATFAADDQAAGGAAAPSVDDYRVMESAQWYAEWLRLLHDDPPLHASPTDQVQAARQETLRRRRQAVATALAQARFTSYLKQERRLARDDFLTRQRNALVHERERIVQTRVLPLLRAHDATAGSSDFTQVDGQRVRRRSASQEALYALDRRFLVQIGDHEERAAHQAAAILSIATVLQDELVERSEGQWVMRGWDQDAAWWWVPRLEEVFARLDSGPALDPWLFEEDRPASTWVASRRAALQNVYDGLFHTLEAHQTEFGFVAVAGEGTIENPGYVHEVESDARHFGPGHALTIDGVTWEIVAVYRSFTFHPALVRSNQRVVRSSKIRFPGESEAHEFQSTSDRATLLQVDRNGVIVTVKRDADGDRILRELAHAVMMQSTIEQLQELAAGMEIGAEILMDLLELVPGAGQAAAIARIAQTIMSTLGDPEVRALIGALLVDPAAVVERLITELSGELTVEKVVEAMLVHPALEHLERLAARLPTQRSVGASARTSRIGRILRKLERVGLGIAGALGRVVDAAHDARDDLQAVVFEHALLARAINLVAEHIYLLSSARQVLASIDTAPAQAREVVRARFDEIVAAVGRVRLPAKLITLEDITSILVELIGRRLGGKYRVAFTVLETVLRRVELWDDLMSGISRAITEVAEAAGARDPAEYLNAWVPFVNERLRAHLQSVQREVHEILSIIYEALPGVTDRLSPLPDELPIQLEGDQFLDEHLVDAQAMLRQGAARLPLATRLELSGGRPLAPAERAGFERQLGQDLSHVRVHTGAAAARATRAAAAKALTTGSHIVLAPDVRTDGESGQRVLRHELVHVLQQTGPRPPGQSDSRPVAGKPGGGLRIDPRAEAVAEEIAARSTEAEVPPVPGEGVQPAFLGIGQRFLDYLLHPSRARREVADIERTGAQTGGQLIGQEVKADVAMLGPAITDWINNFDRDRIAARRRGTFAPALAEIKAWLQSRATAIANAIEDLAIDASETTGRRSDARASRITELDEGSFERKLQRFVLVATGCSIDFELNRTANGRLNSQSPLGSATLTNLNLALIPYEDAGRALWDSMMRETFSGANRTSALVRARARILLFSIGISEEVWDDDRFKIKDHLAGRIRRDAEATASLMLPPADQFWYGSGSPPSDRRQPALWIGRHGDDTHHEMKDRESHHTTQYLLVQYFEMAHRLKPFPDLSNPEVASIFTGSLGFTLQGGKVMRVSPRRAGRDRDILVGELDPNPSQRGRRMPAILVAAVTHRRGRLHVAPFVRDSQSADPDSELTPATQAGQVHAWFQRGLREALRLSDAHLYWEVQQALAGEGGTELTPSDAIEWLRENAADLASAIPRAMRYAYRQMRSVMLPAIKPALEQLEVTWYEELARARGHSVERGRPHHVTSRMVSRVAAAAKRNNQRIMETESGWGP